MNISLYEVIYTFANIFGTYTVYKFMGVFYKSCIIDRKLVAVCYAGYFMANSLTHLLIREPTGSLLINILGIYLLSFLYKSSCKQRILASLLIYIILMLIECLVVISVNFLWREKYDIQIILVISLIMIKIISYAVVLLLQNLKNVKKGYTVTNMQWIAILIIPTGSLTVFQIFIDETQKIDVGLLICLIILFGFNILIFYLYDALEKEYGNKIEYQMIKQQNLYYEKQFKIINETQDTIKTLHHDMKNHVIVLKTLADNSHIHSVSKYLTEYLDILEIDNSIAKSGNVNIDSILNYKAGEAKREGIEVQLKLKIPERIKVSGLDLEVVIGNLFDNAIEAVQKVSVEAKWIKTEIVYERGTVYINFSNPYVGVHKDLRSTKSDNGMHGLGLKSIGRIIEKYNGEMEICNEDKIFKVDVLLYENNCC